MTTYRVTWTYDTDADSPRSAAEQALEVQRDAGSIATVFTVTETDGRGHPAGHPWSVDLLETEASDYRVYGPLDIQPRRNA